MDTKAKIITISSGKGGVGKTCSSVNLSILLAQQGYKVCLFDADANLANVNIMLKLAPEYTLEHVLSAQKSLRDITLHKAGIDI
ncbi:MAG: AAA family ATPase, partial [Gammaproteobacteria bacterium]|nr:AAA family ATPase [Gammaproteobacteria bacterium]